MIMIIIIGRIVTVLKMLYSYMIRDLRYFCGFFNAHKIYFMVRIFIELAIFGVIKMMCDVILSINKHIYSSK